MSRDRLEDLGRLAVIIDNVLDHEIFNENRMLARDFPVWFEAQKPEYQMYWLGKMVQSIDEIENKLAEALKIAKGIDALNGSHK